MVKGTGGPSGDECQNLVAATMGGGSGKRGWCSDTDRATFVVADPISANEGRTYTHEGTKNFRTHNVIMPGVRRLTPVECERLQGLPDGWTDPPGLKTSDSKRYCGLGDAVTANVAEWIGRRLAARMGY